MNIEDFEESGSDDEDVGGVVVAVSAEDELLRQGEEGDPEAVLGRVILSEIGVFENLERLLVVEVEENDKDIGRDSVGVILETRFCSESDAGSKT